MGHIIIVQQIKSEWSKASRGGEGAVRRNTVPDAAKVPLHKVQVPNLTVLHHKLSYGERDDFKTPREETVLNPIVRPLVVGCVTIDQREDGVTARFVYDKECCGIPARHEMPEPFVLTLNQWGQIVYNGKFTCSYESDWWYKKITVNVGVFDPPSNSVFTRSRPTLRHAAIARLY